MDSTPPVIFKRSKAKPAGRTRSTSPKGVSVQENEQESPSTLATKLKNKVKKSRPKSKLSFGGDDEEEGDGEVFQSKKSTLSRKLALGKNAAAVSLNLESTTVSRSNGPTYDDAYLKELKASTPNARPVVVQAENEMSVDINEPPLRVLEIGAESGETAIPSESSIKVTKERRERLRKAKISGEEDYISLAVTRRGDEADGPHPESRLMREEDELGEAEEEFAEYTSAQERIALGKKSRKVEATRRRDEMRELIEEAAEEDEETKEWEEEQLRRGGHLTPDRGVSAAKVKATYKPAPIPAMTPIPVLASAMDRLNQQLAALTTSHANSTTSLDSLERERSDVNEREKEMRSLIERAEEKRAWFSSFKDWIEGVANFLDEKYPLLEKLEDEHVSLLQERFDMIAQRRRADDEDDLATFFGPLPDGDHTQGTANENGSLMLAKHERRLARTTRCQLRLNTRHTDDEEGFSTDSSLPPSDAVAYNDALKRLISRTKDVLNDVKAEEFHRPEKGRWNTWRVKYTDSYVGAWGGLGVVSVWEFWARLELIGWDFIENPLSLDSSKWYSTLYEYSRLGNEGTRVEERELGPDGDLVASMISSAIIPRLCRLLEGGVFDVYSARHVRRMILLTEEIEASVEEGNAKLQMLLRSTLGRFELAIADKEALTARYRFAAATALAFDPETIPARSRYLARLAKLLQNLLRWRKHTGERFGIGMLITRLVENCMIDVARNGWEAGGGEFVHRVASMMPNELIPIRLKKELGF
ncbi:Nineteen complex-related protein 2 domain containing protein [Amanita muscaria]